MLAVKSSHEKNIKEQIKDITSTIINNLSYIYNLSTIYKQIITYNNGSFHHIKYLHNPI